MLNKKTLQKITKITIRQSITKEWIGDPALAGPHLEGILEPIIVGGRKEIIISVNKKIYKKEEKEILKHFKDSSVYISHKYNPNILMCVCP